MFQQFLSFVPSLFFLFNYASHIHLCFNISVFDFNTSQTECVCLFHDLRFVKNVSVCLFFWGIRCTLDLHLVTLRFGVTLITSSIRINTLIADYKILVLLIAEDRMVLIKSVSFWLWWKSCLNLSHKQTYHIS